MTLSCPSCGSENTQKVSLLVSAGTVNSQSRTSGVMLAGGHLGVLGASTRTSNQSALAQQYGPPKPQTGLGCAVFFVAVVLAGFATVIFQYPAVFFGVFAIVMVAGLLRAREVKQEQSRQHNQDLALWYRKFVCMRCGFTFVPPIHVGADDPKDGPDQLRSWNVMVQSMGPRPAHFVKSLRDVAGMSLANAMQIAEALPREIATGLSRGDAEALKENIEVSGAICEIFPVKANIPVIEATGSVGLSNEQFVRPHFMEASGEPIQVEPSLSRFRAAPETNSHMAKPVLVSIMLAIGVLALSYVLFPDYFPPRNIRPDEVTSAPENLPMSVGQCSDIVVKSVGTRLEDVPGSGSEVDFTNGGHQVEYSQVPGMDHSRAGDSVRVCLTSIPEGCPVGDNRGRTYHSTNLRTGENWDAADSEHQCGGA